MAKVSFSVQDLLGLADQQQTAPAHLSPQAQAAGVPAASVVPHAAFCGNCSAAPPAGGARTRRSRAGDAGEQQAGPAEHAHRHGRPAPHSARCHQPARDSTGRTPSPSADDRHSSASGTYQSTVCLHGGLWATARLLCGYMCSSVRLFNLTCLLLQVRKQRRRRRPGLRELGPPTLGNSFR